MRNLDLTALRSFVTVADVGGVTKAAARLNLTQSAVSMQLKRLEEFLGFPVMERSARKIVPNAKGELLLSYARRMLTLNDECWGRLTASEYEGELRFGVPHDIVYPHIPDVLKHFSALYPNIKVRLVSSYTASLKEAFDDGKLDVMMTTEMGSRSSAEKLCDLQLVWVGAKSGRAWKERPVRLASQQRCIFRPISQAALDKAGIPWEMAVDTDSSMTVSASLSADLGLEARLNEAIPSDLEVIDHKGALPPLPALQANIYISDVGNVPYLHELADMVRQAYAVSNVQPLAFAG